MKAVSTGADLRTPKPPLSQQTSKPGTPSAASHVTPEMVGEKQIYTTPPKAKHAYAMMK